MTTTILKPGVFSVGAIDWDARLFDKLIPLPDGTSYNSFLVRGSEKTALIDTVDPSMTEVLAGSLRRLRAGRLDYVIANHAEQDHSGSLPRILELHPEARVLSTPKCKKMLLDLLPLPEDRLQAVADGETISLGGRTLRFIHAPWVHWPETMLTYLEEEKILFSCDFLGSHLAASDLFVRDEGLVYEAAKRYYAEIMMPFRTIIRRNLEKISGLELEVIAPSHGPVYGRPEFILGAYRDWISETVKNEAVIAYVSMHGSTKIMVDFLVEELMKRGVTVRRFDLTDTDIGKLAMALVDAATIVIGSPTVLAAPHPRAVSAAYLANALRPKLKFAGIIGSYGWGGRMVERISELISGLKAELLDPVLSRGAPGEEDFRALERLADEISRKHEALGIKKPRAE